MRLTCVHQVVWEGGRAAELAIALLWVEEKKAQGIVAPNLDRLARKLVVQEAAPAQWGSTAAARS
ncbi:hypothetical protein [Streptomyces dangxiongensis]|uniref:hypothetical protein n=1 Tax=Streptomyces dangxiongensis TaxID=1442032 RepID=UPI0013CEA4F3|nr:hypothetical protein [Streptomyces dangxiongensis]